MSKIHKDLIYSINNRIPISIIENLLSKIDNVNFGTIATDNSTGAEVNPLLALSLSDHPDACDILKLLIQKGADVNTISSVSQRNALMYFTQRNKVNCVELLLQNGAVLDHKCSNGMDVGYFASMTGNTEIIKILTKCGKNNQDNRFTHYINNNASPEFIRILIENSNPNENELCEILLLSINNKPVYSDTIINYMREHDIPLTILNSKLNDFIKNERLSINAWSFIIMNDLKFDLDLVKLHSDNSIGDAYIKLLRIINDKDEKRKRRINC